jgi:hypothetical protein
MTIKPGTTVPNRQQAANLAPQAGIPEQGHRRTQGNDPGALDKAGGVNTCWTAHIRKDAGAFLSLIGSRPADDDIVGDDKNPPDGDRYRAVIVLSADRAADPDAARLCRCAGCALQGRAWGGVQAVAFLAENAD